MKIYTILILFFISKSILAQISYIKYIDTSYIKANKDQFDSQYSINFKLVTLKELRWKIDTVKDAVIKSIFRKGETDSTLIFTYTDSINNKLVEKQLYPSNKLFSLCDYALQIDYIYTFEEEFEPSFYIYLFYSYKKKNGAYRAFYENGNKKVSGQFATNEQVEYKSGNWTHWYENGNLKRIENFVLINHQSAHLGDYLEFYENGQLKVKGVYDLKNLSQGHLDVETGDWDIANRVGEWKEYDINGKLKRSLMYKDNVIINELNY